MGRIALLLLIVAALVTFAIQNQTPIALVVLGTRTLAVPLGIWVLGALGAGAFTTLLLTGFFSLSKAGAVRRAAQRLSDAGSRSPWGGMGTKRGAETSTQSRDTVGFKAADRRSEAQSRRSINDDWEQSDIDRETWDDWGEPTPRRPPQPTSRTNIRDTDDTRARWDDRPDQRPTDPPRRSEPRTDFSARPPVDRYQEDKPQRNSERQNGVYDAEYRVLVPPYGSQPAPVTPPPAPNPPPKPAPEPDPLDDDDDWGLDDLDPKK